MSERHYRYGQFSNEHLKRSKKGLELFNDQFYWECHEVFEDLWKEDVADHARYVWWAVIQVAAAMIHYRDGKESGARGLIKKAKEKFAKCEELGVETKIMYRYLDWEELKSLVRKVPAEPKLSDFKALFHFRFKCVEEISPCP
ncbi:MAG: DUF309 domain-containing protein [Bacteriovoracales bacterium]|nr:DUF309 domain-containing protein [Bacteriovoracales bacterium]